MVEAKDKSRVCVWALEGQRCMEGGVTISLGLHVHKRVWSYKTALSKEQGPQAGSVRHKEVKALG